MPNCRDSSACYIYIHIYIYFNTFPFTRIRDNQTSGWTKGPFLPLSPRLLSTQFFFPYGLKPALIAGQTGSVGKRTVREGGVTELNCEIISFLSGPSES